MVLTGPRNFLPPSRSILNDEFETLGECARIKHGLTFDGSIIYQDFLKLASTLNQRTMDSNSRNNCYIPSRNIKSSKRNKECKSVMNIKLYNH